MEDSPANMEDSPGDKDKTCRRFGAADNPEVFKALIAPEAGRPAPRPRIAAPETTLPRDWASTDRAAQYAIRPRDRRAFPLDRYVRQETANYFGDHPEDKVWEQQERFDSILSKPLTDEEMKKTQKMVALAGQYIKARSLAVQQLLEKKPATVGRPTPEPSTDKEI